MKPGRLVVASGCLLALSSAALAQSPQAAPVDGSRLAVARQVVSVILPPDQRQQIFASFLRSMMQNMITGMVNGTPGLKDELANNVRVKIAFDRFVARQQSLAEADLVAALPALVEAYAKAYARLFTGDELEQVRAFVATPAGAKFMQRGPGLIADPDVAGWQRRVTEQGAARQKAELATFERDLAVARGVKQP